MSEKRILVIHGVTEKGATFRPSDWIDRLSSLGAEYDEQKRLVYSPYFSPKFINDKRCLIVDIALSEIQPELYNQITNFAESNQLKREWFDSMDMLN